jgi:hypothetical protein
VSVDDRIKRMQSEINSLAMRIHTASEQIELDIARVSWLRQEIMTLHSQRFQRAKEGGEGGVDYTDGLSVVGWSS